MVARRTNCGPYRLPKRKDAVKRPQGRPRNDGEFQICLVPPPDHGVHAKLWDGEIAALYRGQRYDT